ncbi:MAG TPA: hypothetical protein VN618_15655 [Solirubrobacteraceae bacterium]|nr:hypothetical protein [Solirubrobacteraceae bacterium]
MKRIARAVTCVLGTLAASAALAAGAGAATPTWYECGKAPKLGGVFTGNYSAKNCEAASEVQGGGKYELREGIGKGKRFKGKGGASTLNVASTLGSVAVQCASSAETGTPALPNLEKGVSFTFKKCVALGSKACTTASAKSGEITITGLKGTLSEIEEAPEVAVTLESEAHPGPEGVIATFTCEGLTATIQGSITARQTQDVNVVTKQFATIDLAAEPYSGPEQSIAAKGEALMVRTGSGASEPPRSVLIGEQLEHENGGDSKQREITPIKFVAAKSGTVEQIFFETSYAYSVEGEGEATSLVLGIEEPGANGKPGKIMGEGTYHGKPGAESIVSVSGLHVPIVKGKTYYLDFLPLGGGISYWYSKAETIIYSVEHDQLTEGMPENYEWRSEAHEAPIGEWAKGS